MVTTIQPRSLIYVMAYKYIRKSDETRVWNQTIFSWRAYIEEYNAFNPASDCQHDIFLDVLVNKMKNIRIEVKLFSPKVHNINVDTLSMNSWKECAARHEKITGNTGKSPLKLHEYLQYRSIWYFSWFFGQQDEEYKHRSKMVFSQSPWNNS